MKEHRENWCDVRRRDVGKMKRILDREVGEFGLGLLRRRMV